MAKIVWSFEAVEDLEEVAKFCEQYSEEYASSMISEIYNRVDQLNSFPRSGRTVPEFGFPQLRELVLSDYRIIYFLSDNADVEIITIHPTARPLPPNLGKSV